MKSISEFINEQRLNEIGDSSAKLYKYKIDSSNLSAEFKTDSKQVYVVKAKNLNSYLEIDFNIKGDDEYNTVNKGEVFSVMRTIVEVIKEFVKRNNDIRGIRYIPAPKFDTVGVDDSGKKRDALYLAYVKRQFPQSKIIKQGAVTYIIF